MLISSMELGSQEELLRALEQEGFRLTQATLSRDLKQLKVAKAASMNGKYVYVLPNETMYRRDCCDSPYILGSIAGDDTIFVAIREGATRGQVLEALSYVIPEIG